METRGQRNGEQQNQSQQSPGSQQQGQGQQRQSGGGGEREQRGASTGMSRRGEGGVEQQRSRGMQRGGMGAMQDPFQEMMRLSDEMDRMFDTFFGRGFGYPRSGRGRGRDLLSEGGARQGLNQLWSPQVDVRRRGNELVVSVDVPGIRREDISIECEDDQLVISGERRSETSSEEQGYQRTERSFGSFYRAVPLPEGVRTEDAKAVCRDGVLEITMPIEERRGRRIEVKGG